MYNLDYLEADLHSCKLCEWRCGVDRLVEYGSDSKLINNNEAPNIKKHYGVCGSTIPQVASSQLHPAPPASFDAFLTGCNFRCLFCQNWSISMFESKTSGLRNTIEGYYDPRQWAELALAWLSTEWAKLIKADRLFFTGGEPTCALPWIEEVVQAARQIIPETKINYDTNGFFTKSSLKRILAFTTSITYDLKAFTPALFSALTGADVKPVLRNLKYIIKNAPEKLWEVRVIVIPGVHEDDIPCLCKFIADLDTNVKLNFLAFRPNFIMESYFGATEELLEHCLSVAQQCGLKNVTISGIPGLPGKLPKYIPVKDIMNKYNLPRNIALPLGFAKWAGCNREIRNCGSCSVRNNCTIKKYQAKEFI